jgi:hypothetical protein
MTTSTITNLTTTSTFQILYLLTLLLLLLLLLLLELNTFIYSPPPLLQLLHAPCQSQLYNIRVS